MNKKTDSVTVTYPGVLVYQSSQKITSVGLSDLFSTTGCLRFFRNMSCYPKTPFTENAGVDVLANHSVQMYKILFTLLARGNERC